MHPSEFKRCSHPHFPLTLTSNSLVGARKRCSSSASSSSALPSVPLRPLSSSRSCEGTAESVFEHAKECRARHLDPENEKGLCNSSAFLIVEACTPRELYVCALTIMKRSEGMWVSDVTLAADGGSGFVVTTEYLPLVAMLWW